MDEGTQTIPQSLAGGLYYLAAAAEMALVTLEDRDLAGDLELEIRRTVLRDAVDTYRTAHACSRFGFPVHYCSPRPR